MPVALTCRLETDDGAVVGIDAGRIVAPRPGLGPAVRLGEGCLRPGLINAHDHLHRNHYPRLGAPPYPDAYAWGLDLHDRWADEVARGRALPRRDALLFGALKNLLGGATTVVHHDPWEPDFERAFPVRVARVRSAHSLGFEPDLAAHAAEGAALPLCIHLAEGTNPAAADEVRALDGLGLLDERLLAVHAVGVDEDGVRRLRRAGAAVVWCPTSNAFLFGRTAPRALIASGVDVLLGSDSLLTGGGTLLDEIAEARRLGWLDEARLADAVGATAARRLHLLPPSLSLGAPADLVHLGRPLLEATARDVRLVVVGGVPRLGDLRFAELFERAGVAVEPLRVEGVDKLVAAPLGSVARRVVARWPESGRILGPPPGAAGRGGADGASSRPADVAPGHAVEAPPSQVVDAAPSQAVEAPPSRREGAAGPRRADTGDRPLRPERTRLRRLVRPLLGRESRVWRWIPWPRLRRLCFGDPVDCVIHALLASRRRVRFIQIGSNDGVTNDPLWTFRRYGNWSGVLVEPLEDAFRRLSRNYAPWKERFVLRRAAVATDGGARLLHHLGGSEEDPPGWDQIASLDPHHVRLHGRSFVSAGMQVVASEVPCLGIRDLFRDHGPEPPDLLHIDAEGGDADILRQLDLGRHQPAVLLYEHLHMDQGERDGLRARIESAGYRTLEIEGDTLAVSGRALDALPVLRASWGLVANRPAGR